MTQEMIWQVAPVYSAPDMVDGRPVRIVHVTTPVLDEFGDPVLDEFGDPVTITTDVEEEWTADSTTSAEWGTFQLVAGTVWVRDEGTGRLAVDTEGTDITTITRGDRTWLTEIRSYTFEEPFGCGPAVFYTDAISAFDDLAADFPWARKGTTVDLWRVHPDGITRSWLWGGQLEAPIFDEAPGGQLGMTLQASGDLQSEAGTRMCHPQLLDDERDIGSVIARALSPEDYSPIAAPFTQFTFSSTTTGITTRKRGSRPQGLMDHVGEMLALAQDDTGQWTVARTYGEDDEAQPRSYTLRYKTAIQESTVALGGDGILVNLRPEGSEAPNVIYGEGQDPTDGSRWRCLKLPNLNPRPDPSFPGAIDYLDADPVYGAEWILRCQAQMLADGWGGDLTGTYDAAMRDAVYRVQADAGLPFADSIDSDTWTAIWTNDGSSESQALSSGYFQPLAADPRVEPYLFYKDGSIKGTNPDFDPTIRRVEQTINFGEDCTKEQAAAWARRKIAEAALGDLVGTVVLDKGISPAERHAYDIREGGVVHVDYWQGGTIDLHIASVVVQPEQARVELTVAQRPYDRLELAAIIARNREAKDDVARAIRGKMRTAKAWKDVKGFDKEAGFGFLPVQEVTTGWNVFRVALGQRTTLASIWAHTSSPPTGYALAFFGKAITASEVAAFVPDPFYDDGSPYKPWDKPEIQADLAAAGFIQAWGEPGKPAGFGTGFADSTPPADLTGELIDDLQMTWLSLTAPWGWVAVYVTEDSHFRMRSRVIIED